MTMTIDPDQRGGAHTTVTRLLHRSATRRVKLRLAPGTTVLQGIVRLLTFAIFLFFAVAP